MVFEAAGLEDASERDNVGNWGMNTAVKMQEVRIKDISVTEDTITAQLMDGRIISVPLAWSWRLSEATPKQRANWRIIGDGHGVHWADIDEDISAEGMLYGIPAPRPRISSKLSAKSEQKKMMANKSLKRDAARDAASLSFSVPLRSCCESIGGSTFGVGN